MRILILPLALAALAGCTATPAETARAAQREEARQLALATQLDGLVPGRPTSCLDQHGSTQLSSYGSTLLYKAGKNTVYRTDTIGACDGVARGDILVTHSPSGRLCRGDLAQTVDSTSHFFTGSCAIGDFVAYRRPR